MLFWSVGGAPLRRLEHPFSKSGNSLTINTKRHIELLELAPGLRRYAGQRQVDANAAFFLVHQALSAAFLVRPDLRSSESLEHSLRHDIDRGFASQPGGARLNLAALA